MNDENLENYLYSQFNEILDSDDDTETKQKKAWQSLYDNRQQHFQPST